MFTDRSVSVPKQFDFGKWLRWLGVGFCAFFLSLALAGYCGAFGRTGGWILIFLGSAVVAISALCFAAAFWREPNPFLRAASGVICLAGMLLFFCRWAHPTENALGGYDEGVYAVTGANLARTGTFFFHPPRLADLPGQLRPWIIKPEPAMANRTKAMPPRHPRYHTCLFEIDAAQGLVAAQFPPGFPVLLGAGYTVAGYSGISAINLLLALGSAVLAGILAAQTQNAAAGAGTFLVFLWCPLQVWAANSLFAEPFLQFLWLLHLLAWERREDLKASSGMLAGLTAGAALLVKIDALPIAAIAAAMVVIGVRKHRAFALFFYIAFALAILVAGFVGWHYNRPYWEDTLRSLVETNHTALILAGVVTLAALVAFFIAKRSQTFRKGAVAVSDENPPRWGTLRWKITFSTALALLTIYAWWLRPNPATPDTFYYWPAANSIRSYREETFLRISWYLHPWGLAVAVAGVIAFFWRPKASWQWLGWIAGILFLVSFCYDLRNNPIQPYGMRRLVPYALPLLLTGMVTIFNRPVAGKNRGRFGLASLAGAAVLAAGFWPVNERLNARPLYPGLRDQIAALANLIPPDAVVLISDTSALSRLASPLEFVHGRSCLMVSVRRNYIPFEQAVKVAIAGWQQQSRRVFFLSDLPNENFSLFGLSPRDFARGKIHTSTLVPSAQRLTTDFTSFDLDWMLRELPPISLPTRL